MKTTHRRRRRRLRPQIVFILWALVIALIFAIGIGIYKSAQGEIDEPEAEVNTPIEPNVPDESDAPESSDAPQESEEPEDEPEEPADEPEEPADEPEKPVVKPEEPADEPEKPVIKPEEPKTPTEPKNPITPRPSVEGETRLSFVAVGDNLIHQAIIDDAKRLADERGLGEKYYFDSMYADFKEVFTAADISFVNQESMIAGDDSAYAGYPHFNTPPQMIDTLENLGIDVVNIATNHSLDLYGKGMRACIDAFKNSGITAIGGYVGKEDQDNIRIIEKEGIKIAFLAYTDFTNEYKLGTGYENIIVAKTDHALMKKQVAEARKIADLVFVSMHWGVEGSFQLSSSQNESAQVLVDAGADLIIGTHPHVIQEVKWKDRPDGKKTLIVYSLGNFISTMHPAYNMCGGLLSVDIVKNENGAYLENALITPTMTHYSLTRDSLRMYYLEDYSQALYDKHGTSIRSESNGWSYDKMVKTYKNTISAEFLPEWVNNW